MERDVTSQLLRAKDERISELAGGAAGGGSSSKRSSDTQLARDHPSATAAHPSRLAAAPSPKFCTLQDLFCACNAQNPLSAGA